MSLLEARDLRLHYGTPRGAVRAVDGISFDIGTPGECVGVVGESGSGKSSLALSLIRLLPNNVVASGGSVIFEGQDLSALSEEEFRRQIRWKAIAMVFQGAMHSLNPVLRVDAQIIERLLLDNYMSKNQAHGRAEELVALVGLHKDIVQRYPHELSGGMKQRVMIAMALTMDPRLLILDEPTSALDVSVQAQVMNLLKRLKQQRGLSMLFITHDIALASDICDRIVVAYAGKHVESGSVEEILHRPKHPYTQRLIASIPRLHSSETPSFLPGLPPDLVDPPKGCRFHPRCPQAFEPCPKFVPHAMTAGGTQKVHCWLYGDPPRKDTHSDLTL